MKTLFFVPEFGDWAHPILQAQIIAPALAIKRAFPDDEVAVMTTCGAAAPQAPGLKFFGKQNAGRGFFREVFSRAELKRVLRNWSPDCVYTCSSVGFAVSKSLASVGHKTFFHCVGIAPEEWVMKRTNGHRERLPISLRGSILNLLEGCAVRTADRIFAVSEAMESHLSAKYRRRAMPLLRMVVDEDAFRPDAQARTIGRELLGCADEDILFVYSGGASVWQGIEDIENQFLALFRSDPRMKLLRIVRDGGGRRSLRTENILSEYDVPHQEVAGFLAASDFGVVLRSDHIVNRVASPIKVAEYLSSGLPVVISPHVGDCSRLIEESGAGIVVPRLDELSPDQIAQLTDRAARMAQAEAARSLARQYFSVEQWASMWAGVRTERETW